MKLLDIARHHGAEILPAISEERLSAFERNNGLSIPSALRKFYAEAGGTGEFTEFGWRIWRFDELTSIHSRAGRNPDFTCLRGHETCPNLHDYIAFVDVLIECPLYAVCANPSNYRYGEVIALAGDSEPFLSGPIDTIEEFEKILSIYWQECVLPDKIESEQAAPRNR